LGEEAREEGALEENTIWSVGSIFGERDKERRDGGTEGEGVKCDFKDIVK
jgi:hypothetical protein